MTDVLRLLPPFEWRGKRYPVTSRAIAFSHEGATSKIQFKDGEFIQQTGARNFTFNYTIPAREDIARGPYKNLFSAGLVPLLIDCRDRSPGVLIDPMYGEFRCVPTSYGDDTDVTKRDGTDIRVEFTHSPEFNEEDPAINQNITGISGLVADAGQLDQQVQAADWNQEPSPEGMTDILSAINGIGRQGLGLADKVSASIADLTTKLEKIEDTADKAENPQNWQLRNSVRRAREAAVRLQRRAGEDPTKKVIEIVRRTAGTVSSIAAELGMPLAEFIRLNPKLVKQPLVAPGTIIRAVRG